MEKKTLGAFIAVLRKAKGMTQKQLAEILNVSDKTISRWERDECAPDLSAIPVLADIFGITADELLRGQRKMPDEPVTHYETQKSGKQIKYLLKMKRTRFSITTCAAIAAAAFGLIAAMIGNLGFLRAYIGFFISCFFYISAILCQVITMVMGLQSIDTEEMDAEAESTRRAMILLSELSISITVCLFAACMPLIFLVHDAFVGLSAGSWAAHGLVWGGIAALLCFLICTVINRRLGYRIFPGLHTPKNKLRIRSALILAAVFFVTVSAHGFLSQLLDANLNWLTPGTKWENWEDLRDYMETPMTDDGQPLEFISSHHNGYIESTTYRLPDGSAYETYEHTIVLVYHEDMQTPKYQCVWRNKYIKRFYISNTNDSLPIYTLNVKQVAEGQDKLTIINIFLCSVYIAELIAGIILYRRKAKELT